MINKLELQIKLLYGLLFAMLGALVNLFVMVVNGGKMPVYTGFYFETDLHFGFTNFSEVNYPYFTDIINLHWFIISIGDILIFFGALIVFFYLGYTTYQVIRENRKIDKFMGEFKNEN